jgi:hypothetical protein
LGEKRPVDEDIIDLWVRGLPEAKCCTSYHSSARRQPVSEFDYYPFRSSRNLEPNRHFKSGSISAMADGLSYTSFGPLMAGNSGDVLKAIIHHALDLIEHGNAVLIIDSAGAERTARVCEGMGYKRS